MARTRELTARPLGPTHVLPGQLAPPLDAVDLPSIPAGGARLSPAERVDAELDALHLDPYRDVLARLGVVPADRLIQQRNHACVLIAGVRVSTGTPPNRSGQRIVFISLDDGTGIADVAFFADAQDAIAGPELFRPGCCSCATAPAAPDPAASR